MAKNLWYGLVEFGGISAGDTTVRVGVSVARSDFPLPKADELLVDRRIDARMVLSTKDDEEQAKLIKTDFELEGTADIKSMAVKKERLAFGLTFAKNSIDLTILLNFAKRKGKLYIVGSAAIPAGQDLVDEDEESNDDSEEAKVPVLSEKSWKKTPIERIFPGAIVTPCQHQGIATIGQLCAFFIAGKQWKDIPGIGESKARSAQMTFDALLAVDDHAFIRDMMEPVGAEG